MATGDLADFFASSASPAGFEVTGTGSLIVPGRRRTREAVRRVRREASALVLWRARRTRARIGAKEVLRSTVRGRSQRTFVFPPLDDRNADCRRRLKM